jgi:uncharacterized protein (TIGR03067 family)
MKPQCLLALVVSGLLAADGGNKEIDKFQGTWKFASVELDGRKVPPEALGGARLVIKGDRFSVVDQKATYHGTFRVDPGQSPKAIDVRFTEGPEKGKVIRGIYEVDGDTYRVCMGQAGKGRPTEFASTPGSGNVLEILKRVRP